MRKEPTPAEKFFWEKVRRRRIGGKKFLRQYLVSHLNVPNRRHYFIADFYCAKARLIVEIDGGYHQQQEAYDRYRERILIEKGFRVIRFKNKEVMENWAEVEKKLEKALGLCLGA